MIVAPGYIASADLIDKYRKHAGTLRRLNISDYEAALDARRRNTRARHRNELAAVRSSLEKLGHGRFAPLLDKEAWWLNKARHDDFVGDERGARRARFQTTRIRAVIREMLAGRQVGEVKIRQLLKEVQ